MLNGGEAARKSFVERCILIYHAKRIAYQECLSNPSTNLNVYVDSNLYVVFWLNTLIWISTWLFDLHHDLSLYTHFVCVEKVKLKKSTLVTTHGHSTSNYKSWSRSGPAIAVSRPLNSQLLMGRLGLFPFQGGHPILWFHEPCQQKKNLWFHPQLLCLEARLCGWYLYHVGSTRNLCWIRGLPE